MRDYSVSFGGRYSHIQPKKSKKGFIFLIIFILITAYVGYTKLFPGASSKVQSEVLSQISEQKTETITPQAGSLDLVDAIKKEVESGEGTFTVYIYDLNTQKEWGVNEETVVTAASINKIPILAAVYHQAETGDVDLERMVTVQEEDIQDYGTGSIRYDKPGSSYSVKTLARLMMEKSDNTAAHILGTYIVPKDKIQELIETWGLTQTDIESNKTSAKDMQILLTKMYHGEITSPQLTKEMMGFMNDSDFEDRLPAGLPDGIKMYHKTGDEVGKIHDAGIVDIPGKPYYIGVFTTDMKDETATKQKIANISRIAYEYMQKN